MLARSTQLQFAAAAKVSQSAVIARSGRGIWLPTPMPSSIRRTPATATGSTGIAAAMRQTAGR